MIKEIEQSWDDLLESLGEKNGEDSLKQIKCELFDFLDHQHHIDKARKNLFKPEFNALLKLYLSRIDLLTLSDKMNSHRKNFVRAFGQDRFLHLKLLVKLKLLLDENRPKKGLLAG